MPTTKSQSNAQGSDVSGNIVRKDKAMSNNNNILAFAGLEVINPKED